MILIEKKMQLSNPIRELGTTMVPVKLHTQVTAQLKVVGKRSIGRESSPHGRSTDKTNSASQSGS